MRAHEIHIADRVRIEIMALTVYISSLPMWWSLSDHDIRRYHWAQTEKCYINHSKIFSSIMPRASTIYSRSSSTIIKPKQALGVSNYLVRVHRRYKALGYKSKYSKRIRTHYRKITDNFFYGRVFVIFRRFHRVCCIKNTALYLIWFAASTRLDRGRGFTGAKRVDKRSQLIMYFVGLCTTHIAAIAADNWISYCL